MLHTWQHSCETKLVSKWWKKIQAVAHPGVRTLTIKWKKSMHFLPASQPLSLWKQLSKLCGLAVRWNSAIVQILLWPAHYYEAFLCFLKCFNHFQTGEGLLYICFYWVDSRLVAMACDGRPDIRLHAWSKYWQKQCMIWVLVYLFL